MLCFGLHVWPLQADHGWQESVVWVRETHHSGAEIRHKFGRRSVEEFFVVSERHIIVVLAFLGHRLNQRNEGEEGRDGSGLRYV